MYVFFFLNKTHLKLNVEIAKALSAHVAPPSVAQEALCSNFQIAACCT